MDATIIVVEDEPGIRATLCGILMEDAGYKVIGLERGADALQMIRRSPFDVLIADIRLPDISGLEILELAKEVNPDAAVIMMTGYASLETAVDAVNQGAYAYFVKPVNPDEMKTTIANALKQQRLSLENKKLVEDLQRTNKLLLEANEELRNEITERKQTEEALQQSEENLKTYLESAPDGVYLNDLKGTFLYGNKKAEEITGYNREELIGKSFLKLNLLPAKHLAKAGKLLVLNAMGRPTGPDELELARRDGSRIWTEITTTPIKQEGKTVVIGFVRDITERKRAEEELIEKTREVEEANRLKSEFLANMSHELRTPLNVIIGFSELMIDKVPGEINGKQRQCLDDILSSGQHLLSLINDVLDLSKVESGKMKLSMANIALPEAMEALIRTMTPILAPRKQSLDIEIEAGLPPVHADKAKLEQVLLNLVDNSSKFTPDGGKLKIEAGRENGWCQVSVIDNGIGINKEDQERMFEPFCQLDNPLTKGKSGTGLGLTLTKQIIERLGGRIWVESEYGKGSRFTFTLPLATE